MIQLKPGDIGFLIHKDNWISKTMSWFMGSRWSHSFLINEHGEMGLYLSETNDFQVIINDLQVYLDDPQVEMELYRCESLSEYERNKIVFKAKEDLGKFYGYFSLISLGIRCVLRRIHIKIKNFIRGGIVCCEHVLNGYTHSPIPGLSGIDPNSIDTEEFYQLVRSCKYNKKKAFKLIYSQEVKHGS